MGTVWMNMRGPELAACGVSSKDETIPVMTPPTIVAIVAVALSTLLSVRALYQSNVANKLTKKSSGFADQARRDAADPRVWLDIRPNDEHAGLLMLYIGNNGPSVATNVRVTFDPPLAFSEPVRANKVEEVTTLLAAGLTSLPPGRRLQWSLGVAHEAVAALSNSGYMIEINAEGPTGALAPVRFPINVSDIRYNLAAPPGTLNGISVSMEKATTKIVNAIREAARDRVDTEDEDDEVDGEQADEDG